MNLHKLYSIFFLPLIISLLTIVVATGCSNKNEALVAKDRDKLLSEADSRGVYENLKNYETDGFSMHKC